MADTPPVDLQRELDRRVLATLSWVLGSVSVLFVVFFVYNAVDLPAGVRGPAMVYDALLAVGAAVALRLVGRGTVTASLAHPVGAVTAVAVAGNVLLVYAMVGSPVYTVYLDIVIVAIGALMLDLRWTLGTMGVVATSWVPVAAAVHEPQDAVRYGFTVLAAGTISLGIHLGRVREEREVVRLATIEREQRGRLQSALEENRRARQELDLKVEERTAELQQTNEALRAEVLERRRAEEEADQLAEQLVHAQRLEALGRLAGGVAHDFNNLLTAITGNVDDVLEEVELTEEHRRSLGDATAAARRAAELTGQLLAFGRRQHLDAADFDLVDAVDALRRMLARTLGDHIQLEVPTTEASVYVHADRAQIEGVVLNLAINARDAMPDGGTLTIRVDTVEHDERTWARLQVRDTGVGMDEATRSRMFEPFFTTKEVGRGTGLGLATAYGVVQQHEGFIDVSTTPGEGTTISVWLPARDAPAVAAPAEQAAPETPTGSETVLLVEDDPAVRRLARRLLRALGYEVLTAADADEAERLAAEADQLDLLFTDVQMPGRDGFELAEALRQERPDLSILLSTGYAGERGLGRRLPSGSHMLPKPYTRVELAHALRTALDGASRAS